MMNVNLIFGILFFLPKQKTVIHQVMNDIYTHISVVVIGDGSPEFPGFSYHNGIL